MPTFIRPQRVEVTEGSGSGAAIVLGAAVLAAVAVVSFLTAHLAVIIAGAALDVAVTAAVVRVLFRRHTVLGVAPRAERAAVAAPVTAEALPAPQRPAIQIHHHLHLTGVTAEDVTAIVAAHQQAITDDGGDT